MLFATKQEMVDHWNEYANKHLVGRTIQAARYLTQEEVAGLGWSTGCVVMQLDDGTLLFPSQDDEGNNAGALFGQKEDESLTFPVVSPL